MAAPISARNGAASNEADERGLPLPRDVGEAAGVGVACGLP
jgi:hypothetical protein